MRNYSNKETRIDYNSLQHQSAMHIVFNSIAEPVFIIDQEGTIFEANKAFAAIFGKTAQGCINANVYNLLPPELAKSRRLKAEEALRTNKQVIFEDERDGLFIRHTITPIAERNGTISRLYIISQDITELKLVRKESKNQQLFSKSVIEAIPGAFYMLDADGRIAGWNTYTRDVILGKPELEIPNTFAIDLVYPDDRPLASEKMFNTLERGVEESEEIRLFLHGGPEFRWFQISCKRIIINGDTFLIGIGSDITDRKEAEKSVLKNSEDRFRRLFEGHSSIMLVIDPVTHNIIDANQAAADFYGWHVETLKMMRAEQISMSSMELVQSDINKIRTSELNRFQSIHKLADGFSRDVEITINIIVIEGKELFYAIINDITERIQAELALQESEKKFRSITEQMSEVVFVADSNGYLTYVSPIVEKVTGYKPDEVIGMSFTDFLVEDEISRAIEIFTEAMALHLTNHILELKYRKKNGSVFYAEVHAQYFENNGSSGVIGVIHDVTNRKHHENIRRIYEHKLRESQQFLQSIYDEVNHSFFVVDVLSNGSYRFKGNNPHHEKQTGVRNQKIIGKTPEEVLDPQTAKAVTSNYDTCIREGKTIQYEELLTSQGNETWWETVLNPVRNETGRIYRIIGTSTNITERKLAENQLHKLNTAIEQSPAIVVITDPEGNIEFVNPMFTLVTGYTVDEVKGKNPRILKSGLMPESLYTELWKTILSGNVWHGELQNKKKNGELYWDQAVISAILNKEGVITNFVAVKLDITEQKSVLTELITAKERAEESDRLKSAFLANISHEIRSPMNGILGFAQLLKYPNVKKNEHTKYIDLIQQSGERMLSLINNLINISRIEAGETMLQVTATSVNELLHDLNTFFMPETDKRGLRLNCIAVLPDNESIIETDSGKLAQILTNLIQNALKFTSKGDIDVGYKRINNTLEFYVIDDGIGISMEMKTKIFDRFHQVDNPLTRTHEGAGLGLSISKAYAEMLGGSIRVESIEDRGCAFYLTLPYNPIGSKKTQPPSPAIQKSVVSFPGMVILIAEDEAVSSLLLHLYLKSEKMTTLSAVNGKEAVILVDHHPEINLVLMDIKMPMMNGYEATRLIKKIRPELPVIAQSAFTSKDEKEKAKEAGCDGFISKPINKNKLLSLMEQVLNR